MALSARTLAAEVLLKVAARWLIFLEAVMVISARRSIKSVSGLKPAALSPALNATARALLAVNDSC
jgi:hypothetical protein